MARDLRLIFEKVVVYLGCFIFSRQNGSCELSGTWSSVWGSEGDFKEVRT